MPNGHEPGVMQWGWELLADTWGGPVMSLFSIFNTATFLPALTMGSIAIGLVLMAWHYLRRQM